MKKTKVVERKRVVRVQVGARMEKTLVKVLKGLAEYLDISLGDLLEGMALHALEGKAPFSKETLGLGLTAKDSHRLVEHRDAKR